MLHCWCFVRLLLWRVIFFCPVDEGGVFVAYADALNTKINNVYTAAGDAQSDLAGIVAGADVLASQFVDVKNTMQYLQALMSELKSNYWYVPVGLIAPFGGSLANQPPAGWLFCDGKAYNGSSSPEYANLFGVIGNAYGGSTIANFQVPDLRGRVALGQTSENNTGAPSLDAGISARARGTKYGSESTTLTSSHIPEHRHDLSSHSHNYDHQHSASVTVPVKAETNFVAGSGDRTAYKPRSSSVGTVYDFAASGSTNTVSQQYGSANTAGPSNNNSGYWGASSPSAVTAVQPSLAVSFIIKF